jgi:hypothetical protein
MNCQIIVGKPRQGKSSYMKQLIRISKKNCLVMDMQNEYGEFYFTNIGDKRVKVKGVGLPEYTEGMSGKARFTGKFEDFLALIIEDGKVKITGYNIFIDEATVHLKGQVKPEIRNAIVSRFHTDNNFIFAFHRLDTVPKDLINMADFLTLFKTLDNPLDIKRRYANDEITRAVLFMQQRPDKSKPCEIDLKNGKIRLPK